MSSILVWMMTAGGGYALRVAVVVVREHTRLRYEHSRAHMLTSVLRAALPGTTVVERRGDGSMVEITVPVIAYEATRAEAPVTGCPGDDAG